MEKLMLATETIFLDNTEEKPCMTAECAKLVEYLRRREFETGLALLDASKTVDESVQEALSFYEPIEEIFEQGTFKHHTKYFLDNSTDRLQQAAEKGFTPVLITEASQEDAAVDYLTFPTVSAFHLSLIQANFEAHTVQ